MFVKKSYCVKVGCSCKARLPNIYRPRSEGDNVLGSVRPSVCLCVYALTAEPFDIGSVNSRRVRLIARMQSIGF